MGERACPPRRGVDLGGELLQPAREHGVEELALGLEVVEQAALGDAGLGGDGVERERLGAVAAHDRRGRVEQPLAGVAARATQWEPARLRPTTPAMISAEAEQLQGGGGLAEGDDPDRGDQRGADGGPDGVGEADRQVAQHEREHPEREAVADDHERATGRGW